MIRRWTVAAALVLAFSKCGDGEDDAGSAPPDGPGEAMVAEVGDPPAEPPPSVEGVHERPPRPTVIASGQTERGEPFEIVLYGTTEGTCIATMFPEEHMPGGGGMCSESLLPRLASPILAAGSSRSGGYEMVEGFARPDVDSVELTFEQDGDTETVDVTVEQLPRKLLEKAGAPEPLGYFIAFLPEGVAAEDVTGTAYDADGGSLGTATWRSPSP